MEDMDPKRKTSRDQVKIKITLTREEYERLKALAEAQGYELVTHYLYSMIKKTLHGGMEQPVSGSSGSIDLDQVVRRIQRTIQDLLNPYTGKLDEISRRIADLYELVESISTRKGEEEPSEKKYREPQEYQRYPRQRYAYREREYREQRPYTRVTAFQRLKEEKIVYESASWIRRPDKLFQSLEREGAVILHFQDGRAAVDPEFWNEFKRRLSEIAVRTVEEVEFLLSSSMGDKAGELFRKLVKEGFAYYDEDRGGWIVAI